jgi:hypothetical protein
MSIDPRYIPAYAIETVILNKDTGAPLSGGLVYFWRDSQRTDPKPVYQITGTSPNYTFIQLPNPMTLSSIGTFVDALDNPVIPYFLPWIGTSDVPDYYFVEVFSSGMVSQFTRESVPYISTGADPSDSANNFDNELTNPQFAEILFANPITLNFLGAALQETPIAPGWDLIVTGTGTVTLAQVTPVGSLNRPSNPGTLLQISSTGITLLRLRQRLQGIPALFAGTNLSGTFLAQTSGSAVTVSMYYLASGGMLDPGIQIVSKLVDTTYAMKYGTAAIPASVSVQSFPDAYVDIYLELPVSVQLEISSVQIVCTNGTAVAEVPYDQESLEKQTNGMYWYDKPLLEFKPIPSMLTGWDFGLNPAQLGTSFTMNTTAAYTWDQTIAVSANAGNPVTRNSLGGGYQVETGSGSDAFYIMQYLSGQDAKEIIGTRLSVNLCAFKGTAGGNVNARVYLFRGSAAAVIPALPLALGTVDSAGTFIKNGLAGQGLNWTEIPRGNLGAATAVLPAITVSSGINGEIDRGFNGWEITDDTEISDTNKFAIIVTFGYPDAATFINIESISLVPGDIPTRPAPQSVSEVLRDCQYYYEKSYALATVVPSVGATDSVLIPQQFSGAGAANIQEHGKTFYFDYKQEKRIAPSLTLYPVQGVLTVNFVTYTMLRDAAVVAVSVGSNPLNFPVASNWAGAIGTFRATYTAANTSVNMQTLTKAAGTWAATDEAIIQFHYTADSRLGIV